MSLRSWPIRFLITRAARAYGFLDPVAFVAKLRGFAQPSEVAEPIELLRAGMLFHARGLLNTKAIQNNLDWIWPFWVERQFNPGDESFIPRAFSFSHINLTHRNWTAVGQPDVPFYPLVDPRGLVTPLFDGWSLDFWLVPREGSPLFPSKLSEFEQTLEFTDNLRVRSVAASTAGTLESSVAMEIQGNEAHAVVTLKAAAVEGAMVAVALRPYNPEGISIIDQIEVINDRCGWTINGRNVVSFGQEPLQHLLSKYSEGDVAHHLRQAREERKSISCSVGLATAAAIFPARAVDSLEVRIPIYDELEPRRRPQIQRVPPWPEAMRGLAKLSVSDTRIQQLYDLAATNLILHAPGDVYPGPFTYKRFWFRDAAFVIHALLSLGAIERSRRAIEAFAPRQRHDGYFLSQEGEWDSNGEALWTYHRFAQLTGEKLPERWLEAVRKGARWIMRKRLPRGRGKPEDGLFPAGFSAEHLGPNDFYYWDDFWGVAGLRAASALFRSSHPTLAQAWSSEADEFLATIEKSFPSGPQRRFPGAIPASPKRRMDSGAVGSLVADYPLQLFAPGDERIAKTADYLVEHSTYQGGFFQNMIHSGINAYLTLHLAQVRLRAGQTTAALQLLERVADLASPTGQWPEAIHPRTFGGCMGDGQHIWAAGEFALMVRNCFVREEGEGLVVASGVSPHWIPRHGTASFGPTLTPWGPVTVSLQRRRDGLAVKVHGEWRGAPPRVEIRAPDFHTERIETPASETELQLAPSS